MGRIDEIRELYRFNTWAGERMFAATAQLTQDELTRDLKNSFPSLRDTLVHVVGADWVWLTRWHGTSPTTFPDAEKLQTNAQILTRWQEIDVDRHAFLAQIDDAGLDRIVSYTNFSGNHFAFPLWQMLRHCVNHATYHRGQVMTMVRQLGYRATSTDLILMYQEKQKAQISA